MLLQYLKRFLLIIMPILFFVIGLIIRFYFVDPALTKSSNLTAIDVKQSFIIAYLETIGETQLSLKITSITHQPSFLKNIYINSLVLPTLI